VVVPSTFQRVPGVRRIAAFAGLPANFVLISTLLITIIAHAIVYRDYCKTHMGALSAVPLIAVTWTASWDFATQGQVPPTIFTSSNYTFQTWPQRKRQVLGSEEVYAGSWLRGYKYSRSKIPSIQMPKHAPIAPRSERPERDGFNYGTDLISRQQGRDVGLCPRFGRHGPLSHNFSIKEWSSCRTGRQQM
jgi:hypothetical protein